MGQELSQAVFQPPRREETYTESSLEGNCEDLGRTQAWLKTLKDTLHVDILCFDYTGYGVHLGEASEKKCYDDLRTVYKHMTTRMGIAPERIVLVGKDLGTAVTVQLIYELALANGKKNHKHKKSYSVLQIPEDIVHIARVGRSHKDEDFGPVPIAGVVLLSSFSSLLSLVEGKANKQAASKTYGDIFVSEKKANAVSCPAFLIHGMQDDVIPIKHARKLASKIGNLWKCLELEDAGHYNLEYADDFLDDFLDFLDFLGKESEEYEEMTVQTPLAKPKVYMDPTKEVTDWLATLSLEQYSSQMIQCGFTDMFALQMIQKVDLLGMGIENEDDIDKLLAAVIDLQTNIPSPPPPTTSTSTFADSVDEEDGDEESLTKDSKSDKEPKRRKPKRSKKTGETKHSRSKSEVEAPIKVVPKDEESFIQLLSTMDTSLNLAPLQNMPARWRQSISFATSINIDFDEIKRTNTLSKGFFGEVFEGVWVTCDGHLTRDVVVRVISYKRSVFRQFCKEALVLSQLKHPNVIDTVGACMSKEQPLCIVLERLSGGSLYNYLHDHPELTLNDRLQLAVGIAQGLEYLHTRIPVIIHRDLSSRNILLSEEGVPKLADFGLGRPPSFIWMAPELYSTKTVSTKVDIYSFGIVLWEILTSKRPFEGQPAAEVALKVARENLRPEIPWMAPEDWVELITSCWHADPEQRPDVQQVLASLANISEDMEVMSIKKGMLLDISFLELCQSDDEEMLMSPTRSHDDLIKHRLEESTSEGSDAVLLSSQSVDSPARKRTKSKHKRSNSSVNTTRKGSRAGSLSSPSVAEDSPKMKRRRKVSASTLDASDATAYTALLVHQLRKIVNQKEFADVEFVVGEKQTVIYGHRAILAARSKHFRSLITTRPEENRYVFPRVKEATFLTIIIYLYTGMLELGSAEQCYDVINVAHDMGMYEVVRVCKEYLGDNNHDIGVVEVTDGTSKNAFDDKLADVEQDLTNMEETLNALNDRLKNLS